MLSFALFPLYPFPYFIDKSPEVIDLIKCLQLLQPELYLSLNLFPLQVVVLKYALNFLDESFLIHIKSLFLQSERPLNILQQMISRPNILFSLQLSLIYDSSYIFFLRV